MKITFISNFHNHHQIPLCDAFLSMQGVSFAFIATERVPDDRIKFGYKHEFDHLPYYQEAIEESDRIAAERLCFESDVVIIGSAPTWFVKRRLKARKLTFSYNERWFKQGFWRHPGDVLRAVQNYTLRNNRSFYQLCASAYTAYDSNRVLAFPRRKYRWGYFPEVKKYADVSTVIASKQPASILWVARFLDWKHPEAAVELARRLKASDVPFTLKMIGTGEEEGAIRERIAQYGLEDSVQMLGSMSPEEVREHMEASRIFLFTSDFGEGWGAVLNEAMNSGCAVVASHAIGSVPYLVEHGKNGFVYTSGNDGELFDCVMRLLSDEALSARLGEQAYRAMIEKWNAEVAAERLMRLCTAALEGDKLPDYSDGPVSRDFGKVKGNGKLKRKKH